jgi:hypothetical protein
VKAALPTAGITGRLAGSAVPVDAAGKYARPEAGIVAGVKRTEGVGVAKEKRAISGSNERQNREEHSGFGLRGWKWRGGHMLGIGKEITIRDEKYYVLEFEP